ncbi:hypothetical protein EC968_003159 [Mortierella alpina]|nr:hypothetical protein EC968_003159 [Mortierella alpina]
MASIVERIKNAATLAVILIVCYVVFIHWVVFLPLVQVVRFIIRASPPSTAEYYNNLIRRNRRTIIRYAIEACVVTMGQEALGKASDLVGMVTSSAGALAHGVGTVGQGALGTASDGVGMVAGGAGAVSHGIGATVQGALGTASDGVGMVAGAAGAVVDGIGAMFQEALRGG